VASPDNAFKMHAGEKAQNTLLTIRNLFDGELLYDNNWRSTKKTTPIFLVFDAIVVQGRNLIAETFRKRLQPADEYLKLRFTAARIDPTRAVPQNAAKIPEIDIYMKEMFEVWDTPFILNNIMAKNSEGNNKLEHENDGLIFTTENCPYYPGTCEKILKWKPIELNSIDF
jgi:mRNA guanylyltransferase